MDEIFGEDGFIACLPRITKTSGAIKTDFFTKKHDYVLVYAKNTEQAMKHFAKKNSSVDNYKEWDSNFGPYVDRPMDISGVMSNKNNRFIFDYNGQKFYPGGKKEFFSNSKWSWRWKESEIVIGLKKGYLHIKKKKQKEDPRIYQKLYFSYELEKENWRLSKIQRTQNYNTLFLEPKYSNEAGGKDLEKVLPGNNFSFPKPVALIKSLLQLSKNQNMKVLDFFAGSGTTGQAVLELNQETHSNHQFILVTNNEQNIAWNSCYKRLSTFIAKKELDASLQVFDIKYKDISFEKDFKKLNKFASEQLKIFKPSFDVENEYLFNSLKALYPQQSAK